MPKLCASCGNLTNSYIKVDTTDTNGFANSVYYCRKLECKSVAEQKFNENRTYQTCSTTECCTLYLPHFSKRHHASYCDECIKGKNAQKYVKQYNIENRDKNRDKNREWYRQHRIEHREQYNAKRRQYYAKNKDKIIEKNRIYWINNKDKINEQQRQRPKFNKIKSKNTFLYDTRRKEYLERGGNIVDVSKTLCNINRAPLECNYCGKSNIHTDICDECAQKQRATEFLLSRGVSFLDIMNEQLC